MQRAFILKKQNCSYNDPKSNRINWLLILFYIVPITVSIIVQLHLTRTVFYETLSSFW